MVHRSDLIIHFPLITILAAKILDGFLIKQVLLIMVFFLVFIRSFFRSTLLNISYLSRWTP